ncbi:RNA-binding protein [Methylobrevis albus]|uniref:RNA-binding protein n=1 Tax=Methylobrevis albus TaxID=2793297 RepID=A0A931MWR7_9HYPH|nr:RNA-binding protein [Methylobrevis albus]MBH0237668.1 RNA-binding protein [Methylobrevis albus]
MAPVKDTAERTCLVTREAQPPGGLIRFVVAPDGGVIPDLRGRLPGRGAWVSARRDIVETAVKKKLFARAFKADVRAGDDLPQQLEDMLEAAALSALSMARKAGLVVTGFGKVQQALERETVIALLHAIEAAPDGRRKVGQFVRRRAAFEAEFGDERVKRREITVIGGIFAGAQLDLALGGANVIHAALLAGGAGNSFLDRAAALARYRGLALDLLGSIPEDGGLAGPGRDEKTIPDDRTRGISPTNGGPPDDGPLE